MVNLIAHMTLHVKISCFHSKRNPYNSLKLKNKMISQISSENWFEKIQEFKILGVKLQWSKLIHKKQVLV